MVLFLGAGLGASGLPGSQGSVLGLVLHADAVIDEVTSLPHPLVLVLLPFSEAPLVGDEDLKDNNIILKSAQHWEEVHFISMT